MHAPLDPCPVFLQAERTALKMPSKISARTLVTEEGKTLDESRGEVRRMIENVEHATGVTT